MSQAPIEHKPQTSSDDTAVEDLIPSVPTETTTNGSLAEAWNQLRKQQDDFDARSRQMEVLREKLEEHLQYQQRLLRDRQARMDAEQQQNQRERDFLNDTKLHIRRCIKEQNEQLEQLRSKQQQLSDYEDGIVKDREELQVQLDTVTKDYKRQIAHLQSEIVESENQVQFWRERVNTLEHAPSPSQHATPRTSDWRFGLSLLCGIITGGVLSMVTAFEFKVGTTLQADHDKIDADQLAAHHVEFSKSVSAHAALQPLEYVGYALVEHIPQEHALLLHGISNQRERGQETLANMADQYVKLAESRRQQELDATMSQIEQLTRDLATLGSDYENAVAKMADERLKIRIENPKKEFQDLYSALLRSRRTFDEVRSNLAKAESELTALQQQQIPLLPTVNAHELKAATAQDKFLKQDLEALRVRLNQLRNLMLTAFAESADSVQAFRAAIDSFAGFLSEQRIMHDDRKIVSAFDELGTRAHELSQLLMDFERGWHTLSESLKHLQVDPQRKECLEIQREIAIKIKEFNYDTQVVLGKLKEEYQRFTQQAQNPAENFELRNNLVTHMRELTQSQWSFAQATRLLLPTSDFRLEAVVHSVVGLTRRVRDRQAKIENDLAIEKKAELEHAKSEKIRAQSKLIASLQSERDDGLSNILTVQDQLSALVPYLEEHGLTSELVEYDDTYLGGIKSKSTTVEQQRSALQARAEELRNAESPFTIQASEVNAWPVNTVDRLSTIGLGGLIATFLLYAFLSLVSKSRTPVAVAHGNDRG